MSYYSNKMTLNSRTVENSLLAKPSKCHLCRKSPRHLMASLRSIKDDPDGPIITYIIMILMITWGIFIRKSSRLIEVFLVLFITLLGASFSPVFSQEAGGRDCQQLNENPDEPQLARDANISTELVTNRRKPLTADSSLAELANRECFL